MKNNCRQKGFIQIAILIAIVIVGVAIIGGTGATFIEYRNLSKTITQSDRLSNEENYTEAIHLVELAQKSWLVHALGFKDAAIKNQLYEIEVRKQHQSIYQVGLEKLDEREWGKAITLFSEIRDDSYYYQNAKLGIEESKRKKLEGELEVETKARRIAERVAEQEEQARKVAEGQARQEALKRATEEVARKEAEQKATSERLAKEEQQREAALQRQRADQEQIARIEAEQKATSERLAKEEQQREAALQRQRGDLEEKTRVLQLAKTHPLIKATISGELRFYIEPLPSYAATGVSSAVEAAARDFSSWTPYGASLRRVYIRNDADLTVSWVRDFGSHTIGEAIFRAHVKVGLGSNNCVGNWSAFDAATVKKILWHELGHSMGYGHSSDPNNVMYSETITRFEVDHEVSEVISGGWYYTIPLCGAGTYSYSFETDDPSTGFDLFVLPPGEDPANISLGSGSVYVDCGKEGMIRFSSSCTVASGARIYIGNTSYQNAIRLTGEIIDRSSPRWPDMTWDQNAFQYDSIQMMKYWELFH